MYKAYDTRILGKTGIRISPVGLGTWQFSQKKGLASTFWSFLDEQTISGIVHVSLEAGINWFDTAEMYGNGQSEKMLSHALGKNNVSIGGAVIATKWWPLFRPAAHITRSIDARLKCLNGYPIDLYQIHQPIGLSGLKAEMNAMAELVEAGKIRAVGISNYSTIQMQRAYEYLAERGIPLASNQVRYSLLSRRIENNGMIAAARDLGITIIAYSPLEQGLLTGKFHRDPSLVKTRPVRKMMPNFRPNGLEKSRPLISLLEETGRKYNAGPAGVALSWLINRHGETVVAIPGASSPEQARENAASMKLALDQEDMERIDHASGKVIS